MRTKSFWVSAIPVLLCSTAVMAQDSGLTLTGTVGVTSIHLPGLESGAATADGGLGDATDPVAVGFTLGVDGTLSLAPLSGFNTFVGFSAWASFASGSTSASTEFDGPGQLVILGSGAPAGAFTIDTGTVDSDDATVTMSGNGDTNNLALNDGSGINYGWGVNPATDPTTGFLYGGIFADGADSGAFAAIANEDGSIFYAGGDLTGVVVTTDTEYDINQAGADLTFGLSGDQQATTIIAGYVGPSVRYLRQNILTTTTVDLPELGTSGGGVNGIDGLVFPLYSLENDETIDSTYIGGVVGIATSTSLSDTISLNIGGEARIYALSSDFSGTSTASVYGGDPSPVPDPTSVTSDATSSSADTTAYGVKGQVGVSWAVADQMQLTLGGSAEYLSRVATLDRPNYSLDPSDFATSDDSVTYSNGSADDASPVITFGDMWSFSATLSLTGQF